MIDSDFKKLLIEEIKNDDVFRLELQKVLLGDINDIVNIEANNYSESSNSLDVDIFIKEDISTSEEILYYGNIEFLNKNFESIWRKVRPFIVNGDKRASRVLFVKEVHEKSFDEHDLFNHKERLNKNITYVRDKAIGLKEDIEFKDLLVFD